MEHSKPVQVRLALNEGYCPIEASGSLSIFERANVEFERRGSPAPFEVAFAAQKRGPVRALGCMTIEATELLGESIPDVLFPLAPAQEPSRYSGREDLIEWLRTHGSTVRVICGLENGIPLLAEAGVLDGRQSAVHWLAAANHQQRFPMVEFLPNQMVVRDGNVVTSVGAESGACLALMVIEDYFGVEAALPVAQHFSLDLRRRSDQSQLHVHMSNKMSVNPEVRAVQEWILASLNQPLSLEQVACIAGQDPEVLQRAFRKFAGVEVREFVEAARLQLACALADDEEVGSFVIAMKAGFASRTVLDDSFLRTFGVDFETYRTRVYKRRRRCRCEH